jgi:hypothetical protein
MRRTSLLLLAFLLGTPGYTADRKALRQIEDSLVSLSQQILSAPADSERLDANESFTGLLYEVLGWEESYNYGFDSLMLISKLWAPDRSFRIFTWYVPLTNGTYEYTGLVHVKGSDKNYRFLLNDESERMKDPSKVSGDHKEWYGAVYTEVILTKHKGRKYYTMLGWDGANSLSNRKVVEVMTLKGGIRPYFGHNIFKAGQTNQRRQIFEYSGKSTMLLRYEEQYLTYAKKQLFKKALFRKENSPQNPKVKKVAELMIVFDRLVPMHSSLEGRYEFYVPSSNIIDAFIWRDGKWTLAKDIDARNPEKKSGRKVKVRPPSDGIIPPQQP